MTNFPARFPLAVAAALAALLPCLAAAQEAGVEKTRDGWLEQRQTGLLVRTKELTLHPTAEPKPALKYQLLPDDFAALPGNAAIFYLKATGFLEQDPAGLPGRLGVARCILQ